MNRYTYRFSVKCPNNNRVVEYRLILDSQRMIMVEDIAKKCKSLKPTYHEQIADQLYDAFGGQQTIRAHHHGVDIETVRGLS